MISGYKVGSIFLNFEIIFTYSAKRANPKLVIDFYNERRKQLLAVKPNRGHEPNHILCKRTFS